MNFVKQVTEIYTKLVIPTVSGSSECYVYCFFVQYLMLYFAGANIIIKGEKTVCR